MTPDGSKSTQPSELISQEEQLLAVAAMFEGNFSIDWLSEMTGYKPTKLLSILENETGKKRISTKGIGIYAFLDDQERHRLLKQLTRQRKKILHQQIANLLMNEISEDESITDQLSHHLLQIPNDFERCQCLIKAGDVYRRRYNIETAFQCYAKVINDLSVLSGEEVDRLYSETSIKYSKLSTARHNTAEVLKILYDAMERAKRLEYKPIQALLHMHIAKNEWLHAKYTQALDSFDTGWKLAKSLNDPKLLREATTFSTFFLYWQGRFKEAVEIYEGTVPNVDKLPEGHFPILAAITVGYCYAQIGQVTQGLGMLDAIRNLCLERGDLYLASYCDGNMGLIMISILRLEEALKYLKRSANDAKKACNDWVLINVLVMTAYLYFLKGDIKKCLRDLRAFLNKSQKVQATVQPYPFLLALSMAMENGDLPKIKGLSLKEEINRKLRGKNLYMKGVAYRYKSYLQSIENQPLEKVIASLNLSLEWGKMSGHTIHIAKTKLDLARAYLYQKNDAKAYALAEEGIEALLPLNENLVPDDFRSLMAKSSKPDNQLKEILQVAQEVVSIRKHKDLIQYVITTVNRLTGAERGAIFFIDNETPQGKLRLGGSKNLTSSQVDNPNFSSSIKLIEKVAQSGAGRIVQDDPDSNDDFFSNETIRSRICVPMFLRDKVVGVLYHDNRLLQSAFEESHIDLLSYFAAIAAISIDNSMAYEEINRLNKKLSKEKQYYQEEHNQSLHFKEIVGNSPAIQRVLSQIEQVAETDAAVIITGETGVGKELVARAIHRLSRRHERPFIRVHCSALSENLIPSELFGHEKGAFTGATSRRLGRFEMADTGTIFLDEMGDISADIQTRLLRVLQTKEFERVGGTTTLMSDFRLIVATNRDLQKELAAGRFRADLYYRLNVFPINVPPLRERREDIPLLVYYFLNIFSNRTGKQFEGIEEEEMKRLISYDWPGNIRELKNVIERACILSKGSYPRIPELDNECGPAGPSSGGVTLKDVEARHILWTLEKTNWKVRGPGGSAELLGLHPSTLRFRMQKLGITRPPITKR
ncbi:MAG: sigma 54-interacting transcriptional regulator [Desulfobacteraceae bacterium]|nr:sigma 54-interacting transcriptional regulator [Pseudomonadota bacterium]MCG2751123.1 sigma 54-interacting transcriptional regulator [Desulfobacteraceae bacterium]